MKQTDIKEADWQEFLKTGSINSYLKYKGINTSGRSAAHNHKNNEDGEVVGSH